MTEQQTGQEAQEYDRWSRPDALSRRGYFLAVLVPVLIAATAFGVVSLFFSDDSGATGTTVRLAVSGESGDAGGDTRIAGIVRMDADHCVYLETGQGNAGPGKIWAVWPAGYRASREGEQLTIVDPDGKTVAHDGDTVSMTGSYAPAGSFSSEPCVPDSGEVAVIQSHVSVVE